MKEEKCEIIYDLLPIYVDNLTSDTTNKYIEEHLNNCTVCEQAFEDMKSDIEDIKLEEIQTLNQDNDFIDAFKRIRSKIQNLELIISVLAVLLIVQLVI